MSELKGIKQKLVPEGELNKAKEYLTGNTLMELESSDEMAEYFGGQEIFHRPLLAPQEYIEKIRKVTAVQVRGAARMLFKNNKANLAIIGPFKKGSHFKKIIKL